MGRMGSSRPTADTAERLVSLSRPSTDELGALTYQLILDPVGAAALEAAIGPLSTPVPGPNGERDPRSPQLRRGQALIEVCRRASSATDRPPSGVKTTLMLTMSYRRPRNSGRCRHGGRFRSGWLAHRAGDGAPARVRRRGHPDRPRQPPGDPRSRPLDASRDAGAVGGPVVAGSGLQFPWVHDTGALVRRPPPDPLGRRREDPPHQLGVAVRTTPQRRPPRPSHRPHHHQHRHWHSHWH
jgi:hypothetical protein